MRALSVDYSRRELREREITEPVISAPDHVLFRVREIGICGTDRGLAAFELGHGPEGDEFLVIGHEATGEVVSAGPQAVGFRSGDIVVPTVRRACSPPCASCRRGRRDLCLSGRYTERGIIGAHGYFTDLAIDRAEDLIRIPAGLAGFAVLIEPLSVVEKAVTEAVRLHQGDPRVALVLGAGPIGLLATMVLRLRGYEVDVVSPEPSDSPRAELITEVEGRYLARTDRAADIVIEAAGAPEAIAAGLQALAPMGVLVVLGARETAGPLPLIDLILGNRIVAGSVNASPEAFAQAVGDLLRFPAAILNRMIERTDRSKFRRTLTGPLPAVPKIVHVFG